MTYPLFFSVLSLFGVFFVFSMKMLEIRGRVFVFWNRIRFYSDMVYDFGSTLFHSLLEWAREAGKSAAVAWFIRICRLTAHSLDSLSLVFQNVRDFLRAKIHITIRRHRDDQSV